LRNHYTLEGIFRLSGAAAEIQELKQDFDKGNDVDLQDCNDPHVVAGLLKQFLRELPDPIFTYDMYDNFIHTHRMYLWPLVTRTHTRAAY
jgi:hypothetical protein